MIQANELRIGNLILNNDGQTTKVSLLCGNLISVSDSNSVNEKAAKAIPLTEEWLINLGFEKIREYFSYDNHELEIQKDVNGYYTHINCGNLYINSIHQLQNLYFALTGSELALKPIVPEAI